MYLLIINMSFVAKILAYKTSSWVFILHRKKCNTHNNMKHHLPRQMIPDITFNFVSYLYLFDYLYPVFDKILGYKTSSWAFILHRKKCNTHNHIKHHLPGHPFQVNDQFCYKYDWSIPVLYLLNVCDLEQELWSIKRIYGKLILRGFF